MKNRTYYFFNEIINIKNVDPNNVKIDKKTYKYSYLLYWMSDNKRFKIRKNL